MAVTVVSLTKNHAKKRAEPAATPRICESFEQRYTATEAPLELDRRCLNVFLRCGVLPSDSTIFTNLKFTAPPLVVHEKPTSLTRSQVIDAYIDLFRKAVS